MKIVVRGTNWIGDAVMTIPAMRELRRIFPDAEITLHTRAWAEGIFRDAAYVNDIIGFDEKGSNISTVLEQARTLRRRDFDLGIIFPNSYRSAAIAKLGRVRRRFGYSKEGRRMLLTDPIKIPDWKSTRHETHYYLELVSHVEREMLGTDTAASDETIPTLDVSPERRAAAHRLLIDAGCEPGKPVVALGPGSTNSMAKRWPVYNFATLADDIRDSVTPNIVLLGSAAESDVAEALKTRSVAPLIDLTGRTSLAEAVGILAAANVFVSNDMGLAHVSAAAGTPTAVIFGPTDPATTRPLGPAVKIIREAVECSPCMLRECPIDHRCMTRIAPERVLQSVRELLEISTDL